MTGERFLLSSHINRSFSYDQNGISLLQSYGRLKWNRKRKQKVPDLLIEDFFNWSGIRDSNSRLSPWQGDTLPLS